MRRRKMKMKLLLVSLISTLFVNCGGGGGGGGSSNLPLNPSNPVVPNRPGDISRPSPKNPTVPANFSTTTNSLDTQKKILGLSKLKEKLVDNRENSTEVIPTDNPYKSNMLGSTQKIAILDSDFLHDHDYNNHFDSLSIVSKYRIDILGRVDSNDSISPHGEHVLEVLVGRNINEKAVKTSPNGPQNYVSQNWLNLNVIAASIGNGGIDENNKGIEANLTIYRKIFEKFGNQKVKVFNQSWGSAKTIKDDEFRNKNLSNYVFDRNEANPLIMPFFKDAVNNKGSLFVWSAGNEPTDDVTLEAGLPYFDKSLEKGWIAVIGIASEESYRDGMQLKKVSNGRINIHRTGADRLAYAGEDAKYWSISANDQSIFWPNKNGKGYTYELGSSYAAPKVSRAAALVAEKYSWMTPNQVRQTLFTTTDDTEISSKLVGEDRRRVKTAPDFKYGWGMLETDRALKGPGAFINIMSDPKASSDFIANITGAEVSYFENSIFGVGGLRKKGTGVLHLTANNTFFGSTIIDEGKVDIYQIHSSPVIVNKNGYLTLHSKAIIGYNVPYTQILKQSYQVDPTKITTNTNLVNRGIVEVIGTTSIVGGDYVAYKGSQTVFNNGSKLNVLGNIKIEDSSVKVLSNNYVTAEGLSKTLIEGKLIEGNFSNIETNGMRTVNVEIKDGKVVATVSRENPEEYIGREALVSTKNVATNVENVFQDLDKKVKAGTVTKEELIMASNMQNMSRTAFSSASEKMSGEIYASAQALTFSQSQNINRDLSNRLSSLDNFVNSNKDSGAWFSVIGSGGKLRRAGYASADTRVTGGQFGIDTKIGGTITLGVAMNYSYAKANFNRYAGESKSDMVGVSLYGKQDLPYGLYTAGRIGLSNISSKVERELLTSTGETITGKIKHHDKMLSAYVEIGKKIGWLTPFVGYSQDYLRRGSFNESEASWGVKADSKNYRTSNFLVGARAEYVGDKYKLQAYVTQAINTEKRDLSYEGRFTGSSVKQKFYGVKQSKNITWIGFGVFRELTPAFGVYGNVDFRVEDKKWADSVISTGLQYRF